MARAIAGVPTIPILMARTGSSSKRARAVCMASCGESGSLTFIKRVIGLPGETVSERNGIVFVNGRRLSEGYVPASDEFEAAIAELRSAIRAGTGAATTFGYGPRFLHSTGQLHKGGPPTGRFLQLVDDPQRDAEIPGAGYSFGTLIAAQAAGPSRQAFGTARESLLGVRALLADGTRVKSGGRVVKNVAGYDLHKLLVGSFGTLAVIAEATFKLQPLPEAKRIVSYGSAPLASLFDLARMLADSALGVQFLEVLAGTSSDPMLVAGFAGVAEDVDEASRRAAAYATDLGIDAREPFDEALLWKRLDEFERVPSQAVVVRAGMPRTDLRSWVSVSLEQCAAIAGRVRAHAHGGLGVARLRLDEVDPQRFEPVFANLRQTARRGGGYLILEHAQAPWKRSLDVWGPPPAGHHLMKAIKAAFDPHRRLAPGRFVGGL